MSSVRKIVFANEQIYHIYNRGVDKRNIFTTTKDYKRAIETIQYYRFSQPPVRLSKYLTLNDSEKCKLVAKHQKLSNLIVDILAFCLMPNHFHLLLRQKVENGISKFASNFSNSYTKYFNTKNSRSGVLLEGTFKATRPETDEEIIHLSRYIHLNPISNFLINKSQLAHYAWSSLQFYLGSRNDNFVESATILSKFKSSQKYLQFLNDQISYSQELEKIKHLTLEN